MNSSVEKLAMFYLRSTWLIEDKCRNVTMSKENDAFWDRFDRWITEFCFHVIADDRRGSLMIAGIEHFLSQRSSPIAIAHDRS